MEQGGSKIDGHAPGCAAEQESGDIRADLTDGLQPGREIDSVRIFGREGDRPDQKKAPQTKDKASCRPDGKRKRPAEPLTQEADGDKGQDDTQVPRSALDSHGEVDALSGMCPGNPGQPHGVVKAVKNPEEDIEKEESDIGPGEGDQE
jgi:hypothetical protein